MMDTYEAGGFFPEREVLRARRLNAMAPEPVDPSEARRRRTEMWVLWVTVFVPMFFLPMFVNAIVFGWNSHMTPRSMAVLMYILWLILAACGVCAAVAIWRNLIRPNNPSS
jgi:hypothetical protein